MKPWQRHAITSLVVLTSPIWFAPALLIAIVAFIVSGMYESIHRMLWGR